MYERARMICMAAVVLVGSISVANAFEGSFWDVDCDCSSGQLSWNLNPLGASYLAKVDTIIAQKPPDAQFNTTRIEYLGDGSVYQTPEDFLGGNGSFVSGSTGTSMLGSIIRIRGEIGLSSGWNRFEVASDDGFRLSVDGVNVLWFDGLRQRTPPTIGDFNWSSTVPNWSPGVHSFELIYFEARPGSAALVFTVNGKVVEVELPPPPSIFRVVSPPDFKYKVTFETQCGFALAGKCIREDLVGICIGGLCFRLPQEIKPPPCLVCR